MALAAPTPVEDARAAGLVYTNDREPGIRRVRHGGGFRYLRPSGAPLRTNAELARIRRLAIPPAWRDVWICISDRGHLQATGRDARGRKQYRYHERFRAARDANKYGRLLAFGEALPALRDRLRRDLARDGLPRDKVAAAVIRLLRTTAMRVGNDEYRRENRSYGLTTLRSTHVDVARGRLAFRFRGKSGKEQTVDVDDPRLARIVRRCQDLPGQELFQYVDGDGAAQPVGSSDVNAYLRDAMGDDFSAKDFRTWHASAIAAGALRQLRPARSAREAKRKVKAAIERVATVLGNTPVVCRASYVHPAVIEAFADGTLFATRLARSRRRDGLDADERLLLALLRRRERAGRSGGTRRAA
ncbi:MAG TPA: DNA topoisomerase IB [Candidatus Dormibacteraeota bacterium]|jgi:DNA topoisomerase-1|nr:DNA topoisomerase IB [Candidatus Dormibacteraeota bacterium]